MASVGQRFASPIRLEPGGAPRARGACVWLDPVLVLALALAAGPTFAVAPWPAALGTLGAGVLLLRHAPPRLVLAALVFLAAGALRAEHALARFDHERQVARDELGQPQRCALHGVVDVQPMQVGGRTISALRVSAAECETGRIEAGIRVRLGGNPEALARGDRVFVVAQLAPLELLFNAELNSPLPFAARRGVLLSGSALAIEIESAGTGLLAWIDHERARVRERILQTFAPTAQPMARALVLGENDLDPDDAVAFRNSGLAHMLAVSGTHLVFAVVSVVRVLSALLVRVQWLAAGRDVGRLTALFGAVLALAYADFAGGSGSAWRAAFMLAAAYTARALGRAPLPSRALAASVLLGWFWDPLVAFDISFLLSFAATAGLLLLGEPFGRPCQRIRSRLGRALGLGMATTLSAMVPCAPLLAVLGTDLTLAGVIANVIASPLGETIALPLCLAHAVVSRWPTLESGVGLVASGALLVVRQIAHESAAQRWLAIPMPEPNGYHLALCITLGVAVVLARQAPVLWQRLWVAAAALGLALVELAARSAGAPQGQLRLTSLSVGQGDATLVDFPNGVLMLIDAGGNSAGADPGERVVVPILRSRRRDHLDVMVVSHPHLDHFGGLLAVLRSVSVGEIWDSGQGTPEEPGSLHAQLLAEAEARGIPVRTPSELCAGPRRFGTASVTVLSPCPHYVRERGANDNSLVLRVELGKRVFLLTGDAESETEADLVQHFSKQLRADVLKAGHHGSPTSSTVGFVAAVAPQFAVLSCGARNRFGHPSPEVVARFRRQNSHVLRTDQHGSITFSTDGSSLGVRSARPALAHPGD